ncbi:SDR family NAD(P)-dependent oxidoreductase [Streptococcus ictaluri]|uniref:KR domain protein n=1 Tax=Streptococcus ictaluri 707-05 TaxID=764299 RepID=G5K3E8_9STRE|nr:SDR family NAD(P)-dependent oxidoreductase [Streptococcus ictaluri]EHI69738.1 KR domain protein [Streptococcus ictaluri 707-05]
MNSKIALVTGASAGFGKAIVAQLIEDGFSVIGAARRLEKLQALEELYGKENFLALPMDVSNPKEIDLALTKIPKEWQSIDLLINNAGLALGLDKAFEADFANWMTMINTNIIGLTYLTHQLLPDMVKRNSGMIINMGSTAGTIPYPGANIYGASKAFVKQFSLNLRADLAGTKIRVTNIEPGLCEGTEFSNVRFKGDRDRVEAIYKGANAIQAKDIANTVSWIVNQPPHVNINRIEIMPVSQSYGPQPVSREDV